MSSVNDVRRPRHYKLIWRWHFFAGLLVLPVVLTLAVTGALYLFQTEIEDWLYADRLFLDAPYHGALDHTAIVRAAGAGRGTVHVQSYQPPPAAERSAQVTLQDGGGTRRTVFLHPGTRATLGTLDEDWRPMNLAREIHKGLLLGTPGRVVTELAACWLILLLLSGLYLWWPRGDRQRGALIPVLRTAGRSRWRELHAVAGAWVSLWVLALLLTGLPWALVWGGLLDQAARAAGEGFPAAVFEARPDSRSAPGAPDIDLNTLVALAHAQGAHHGFKIDFPWHANGSYGVLPSQHSHTSDAVLYLFFDRRDGALLERFGWRELGKVGRLTSLGVAFHQGLLFGAANQWLNLTAVLGFILLCVTGPVLWWKRRRPGQFPDAPRAAPQRPAPPLLAGLVVAGVLLPLLGASLLLLWLAGRVTRRAAVG